MSTPELRSVAIVDAASLDEWRGQLLSLTPTHHLPAVEFRLPQLSSERNRSLSAVADGYRKECGCTTGRFLMSAGFAFSVLGYFLSGGRISGVGMRQVLSLVGVTVVAALTGKLAGLLWARWRLIRLGHQAYVAALGSFSAGRSPAKG